MPHTGQTAHLGRIDGNTRELFHSVLSRYCRKLRSARQTRLRSDPLPQGNLPGAIQPRERYGVFRRLRGKCSSPNSGITRSQTAFRETF